jgi:hypothetical protein
VRLGGADEHVDEYLPGGGNGEPLCSFLGCVVVDQVVTVKPEGRTVAVRDKRVRGGNPCRVRGGLKGGSPRGI